MDASGEDDAYRRVKAFTILELSCLATTGDATDNSKQTGGRTVILRLWLPSKRLLCESKGVRAPEGHLSSISAEYFSYHVIAHASERSVLDAIDIVVHARRSSLPPQMCAA